MFCLGYCNSLLARYLLVTLPFVSLFSHCSQTMILLKHKTDHVTSVLKTLHRFFISLKSPSVATKTPCDRAALTLWFHLLFSRDLLWSSRTGLLAISWTLQALGPLLPLSFAWNVPLPDVFIPNFLTSFKYFLKYLLNKAFPERLF